MIGESPAEVASKKALNEMFTAISSNKCFRFDAGAGAGKTYSLIKALYFLINEKFKFFQKNNQQIACITYTNIAKKQIKDRTDNNPIIFTDTIHAFSWDLLKGFQKLLRMHVVELGDEWLARIEEAGGIKSQEVVYELGYPKIDAETISLDHDDVISLMAKFLAKPKFQVLLKNKFPVILVDEYQDTNIELAKSIVQNLIENNSGVLIGLFGDHWQKIYGDNGCGLISSANIREISKNANFRSDKNIVFCLNRMRPSLKQNEFDPNSCGEIKVFHSNEWLGARKKGAHWGGDLPDTDAQIYFEKVTNALKKSGWCFESDETKILMLTNKVLASKQGYDKLADCFKYPDDYLKKNDPYIKFFLDTLEPACEYFEKKEYGKMFNLLNKKQPLLLCRTNKIDWMTGFNELISLRTSSTVDSVINHLKTFSRPRLSPKIAVTEKRFHDLIDSSKNGSLLEETDTKFLDKISKFKAIPYLEVINLYLFIENRTLFSTKHGVKGAEFDNVLVICGRGWNQYNWNRLLEGLKDSVTIEDPVTYERNRNLFYVACSRAKKRLAILFTQELSAKALEEVKTIFGSENIMLDPTK
jgi:DNA helicase-2/ATP-dependent DNA helicase PcrA